MNLILPTTTKHCDNLTKTAVVDFSLSFSLFQFYTPLQPFYTIPVCTASVMVLGLFLLLPLHLQQWTKYLNTLLRKVEKYSKVSGLFTLPEALHWSFKRKCFIEEKKNCAKLNYSNEINSIFLYWIFFAAIEIALRSAKWIANWMKMCKYSSITNSNAKEILCCN